MARVPSVSPTLFPLLSRTLRIRHALSSSPFYASFVVRVASTAISSARGAIRTDNFHTLLVERLDERSISVFRSSVGNKRGHVVREKEHVARQADLPFPRDTNGSYND